MGVVTQSSQVLSIQESALGTLSALSSEYIKYPNMSWRVLFMHEMPVALALALPRAGRSRLARIAIMAMTTSSSMRVNATRKSGRRSTLSDGMQEFIGSFAFQVVGSNGCLLETGYSWYRHTLERTGNRSSQKSAPEKRRVTSKVGEAPTTHNTNGIAPASPRLARQRLPWVRVFIVGKPQRGFGEYWAHLGA